MMTLQSKALAIVMGGGAGTRLFPLTQKRAKPAVPLAGRYRLVDVPISNCLNSGFRQVYVLTQFNSESLHRHITTSYKFDGFTKSFVEILAAQQTPEGARWYQGTADAVRQNLRYFLERPYEHYLILSGDHLYRMDYGDLLQAHLQSGADVTLGTTPVDRQAASGFGILHSDAKRHIFRFEEKPKDPRLLDELRIPPELLKELGRPSDAELYQGSMGALELNIYWIPTDLKQTGTEVEARYLEIVHRVKGSISIPVAVKLSPFFSSFANVAASLVQAGANGLVLFNRFYQPDIDLETFCVTPNILLSSPMAMRLSLRWIAILRGRLDVDLAATGGIHDAKDVIKMVMAGADVAMLCSVLLRRGIDHIKVIEREMKDWLLEHEYDSLEQMKGSMSQKNCPDPDAFERAQYVRGISTSWQTVRDT